MGADAALNTVPHKRRAFQLNAFFVRCEKKLSHALFLSPSAMASDISFFFVSNKDVKYLSVSINVFHGYSATRNPEAASTLELLKSSLP